MKRNTFTSILLLDYGVQRCGKTINWQYTIRSKQRLLFFEKEADLKKKVFVSF